MIRKLLYVVFIMTLGLSLLSAVMDNRASATASQVSDSPTGKEDGEIPAVVAKPLTEEEKNKIMADHTIFLSSIKRCAGIDDRAVRISCYDSISESLGYLSPTRFQADEQKLEKFGFWQLSRKARPDGVMQTYLRLESNNKILSRGGTDRHVSLVIRCIPGKTDVFLDWKSMITGNLRAGSAKKAVVTYYSMPETKHTEDWEISTDRYALFSMDSVAFVRNITKQKNLTMELIPEASTVQAVYFDIDGIDAGIDTIVKSCY